LRLLETAALEFSFLAPASEELGLSQVLLSRLNHRYHRPRHPRRLSSEARRL